ncbi:MAG: triose-phosphate isomerase [Pseudomonadota bacterium]
MTTPAQRQYLIAGNWKMNGSLTANSALLDGILAGVSQLDGVEFLVCPPTVYLDSVNSQIGNASLRLGAQNVSEYESGAYTGEVSARMLTEFGCRYVLVGHSERRSLFAELNEQVADKFAAAVEAGLKPVLCVGETLAQREAGDTETVVGRQLKAVTDLVGVAGFGQAVVAYEPVWAIGTGQTATPEQAQAVHAFIRAELAELDSALAQTTRIVYGGSMKAANAAGLLSMPDIDGGLIGGASLKADDFLAIGSAASEAISK